MDSPSALHAALWSSPLGDLLLVANDQALCGVFFADQTGIPAWAHNASANVQHPLLVCAMEQLSAYFAAESDGFDIPLTFIDGTAFQRAVWEQLKRIPYGHTVSYGQLAQAIGRPSAVRALGGAVGRNPLGIVLPCHRVVGARGEITGYTGGLARKVALLQLESV